MKNTVKLILTAFLVLLGLCVCSGAVSADDLSYQYPQGLNPPQLGDVPIAPVPPPEPYDPDSYVPDFYVPEQPPLPQLHQSSSDIIEDLVIFIWVYGESLGMTDEQIYIIYYPLCIILEVIVPILVDVYHIPISVDDACDRLAVLISYIYNTYMT